MPVNIFVGPPTYNKAPSPPKGPSEKLFPFHNLIKDQSPYWVSLPLPDKLHLSVGLNPKHFSPGFKPAEAHDYGRMLMHALATGQAGPATVLQYLPAHMIHTKVQVQFGSDQVPVYFELKKTPKAHDGPHTLIIQMNPAKLGEDGVFDFLDRLHSGTQGRLLVGSMLADARISLLDVAIDIVGIRLFDLLVSSKLEKRREQICSASTGDLETIMLHPGTTMVVQGAGKKLRKSTARMVKAYDKRREQIASGVSPPYGDAPVSRVEVTKKRFGSKHTTLQTLPLLSNPFAGV